MHRFKKMKVPAGHGPPQNSKELIAKAYMMCCVCDKSLLELSKRVFICSTCSTKEELKAGNALYWCKDCSKSSEHEHKLTKLKHQFVGKTSEGQDEASKTVLENLFEDYHRHDFEDVIAGG